MNLSENKVFHNALEVISYINRQGYEAYIVGGAVRNLCLDIPLSDIDINTSALPEEIESIFDRTVPVGKEHGTILVIHNDMPFEVTTFRTDGSYSDSRRPDEVTFVKSLLEDVKRRDFTVNALAMDKHLEVIDLVEGKKDIQDRLIRAVGHPFSRFQEDALRMLRAARFQSVLEFDIEIETYNAIKDSKSNIQHIAVERIVNEMDKLISGAAPYRGLQTLNETGLVEFIPFFKSVKSFVYPKQSVNWPTFLGYLINQQPDLQNQLTTLKLSNLTKKSVSKANDIFHMLKSHPDDNELKLMIYDYGKEQVLFAIDFLSAIDIISIERHKIEGMVLPITSQEELQVDGRILMRHLNRNGGIWLKEMLRYIVIEVVQNRLTNQRTEILKWVDNHVKI